LKKVVQIVCQASLVMFMLALLALHCQQIRDNGEHVLLFVEVDSLKLIRRHDAPLCARLQVRVNIFHFQKRHLNRTGVTISR
jgi:hypothetical protein